MNKLNCILLAATLATLPAHAASRYLNSSATGLNNGTSWTDAWTNVASINWASVAPGDTIYMHGEPGGTNVYGGFTIGKSGTTAGGNITFSVSDEAGHNGIVQTGNVACGSFTNLTFIGGTSTNDVRWKNRGTSFGFFSSNARNLRFHFIDIYGVGITLQDDSTGYGIRLGGNAQNCYVEGVRIEYTWNDGINAGALTLASHQTNLVVRQCTFINMGDDGVQANRCFTVEDCVFNGGVGRATTHNDGIQGVGPLIRIANNAFTGFDQCLFIETTVQNGGSGGFDIWNNVIHDTADTYFTGKGILLKAKGLNNTTTLSRQWWTNVNVLNNTIVNLPNQMALRIYPEDQITNFIGTNVLIANNIIVDVYTNTPAANAIELSFNSGGENIMLATNIVAGTNKKIQIISTSYADAEAANANAWAEGNSSTSPSFVGWASYDYRLAEGSAGIGDGLDLSSYFTTDITGETRNTWDIGAYAFGDLSAPIITLNPVSDTVVVGATAVFTAAASGNPSPTYQWEKNGMELPGETGTTLTISNVQESDAGSYTMVATNSQGSDESDAAVLTVTPAATSTNPFVPPGQLKRRGRR